MGRLAHVTSIDVLETVAVALKKFRGECGSALDDLDIEIQRAMEWIHHDRKDYWLRELRRSEEAVNEARVQLLQAQAARRVGDMKPSCVDEQRALERARIRRQTAEEKGKAVQQFAHSIDRIIDTCRRERTQFAIWLESGVQKGITVLDRKSDSLENYIAVEVAVDAHAVSSLSPETAANGPQEVKSDEPASPSGAASPVEKKDAGT
jgi:hypothetical protein